MVHLIVEHLLSTSGNRLLYESLWNLAASKSYKNGNSRTFDDQNISEICNDLIREIKRDDPDRNKFYFSTQIVFGTLVLFRLQVNKLYDQAKCALLAYNSTFYKIDWMSQVEGYPSDSEAEQPTTSKTIQKNDPKKQKKTKQQLKRAFDTDFALIERVLDIPEAPEPKSKKGKAKAQRTVDGIDPTLAISVNQITIIDQNNAINSYRGLDDDEFGAFDQTYDLLFDNPATNRANIFSSTKLDYDQEVPEVLIAPESPDNLRKAASPGLDQLAGHELSLTENIQEILESHKKPRKRRSSISNNISLRLEPPIKQPRIDEDNPVDDGEDAPKQLSTTIPSFDNQANDVGIDQNQDVHMFDLSDPSNFADLSFALPKVAVAQLSKKINKRKSKLLVDKQIVIKTITLDETFAIYRNKSVVASPLDTFELQTFHSKSTVDNLFHTPASRLKGCARNLLPVYERNLKKLSSNLLKRKINHQAHEDEQSPPKRQRLEKKKELQVKKIEFVAENQIEVVPPVVDSTDLPAELDPPIVTEAPLPEFEDVPLAETVNNDINAMPEISPIKKRKAVKRVAELRDYRDDSNGYKECDKWSPTKIMNNLKGFWKRKDDSITMEKLTSQSNRFVAAGIFFELMVLSKVGAVELTQGSDLHIANISAGKRQKIYM